MASSVPSTTKDAGNAANPTSKPKAMPTFPTTVGKVVLSKDEDQPSTNRAIATYSEQLAAELKAKALMKEYEDLGFTIGLIPDVNRIDKSGGPLFPFVELVGPAKQVAVWGGMKPEMGGLAKRLCFLKGVEVMDEKGMKGVIM